MYAQTGTAIQLIHFKAMTYLNTEHTVEDNTVIKLSSQFQTAHTHRNQGFLHLSLSKRTPIKK